MSAAIRFRAVPVLWLSLALIACAEPIDVKPGDPDKGDAGTATDTGAETSPTFDAGEGGGTCQSGETLGCYTGPPASQGQGECKDGIATCVGGVFGVCEGETLPVDEECNGVDDDCDGIVDEGCTCTTGDSRPCYAGADGTAGVGPCSAGTQSCEGGQWGSTCAGQVLPVAETCNAVDDDCDGAVDNVSSPRLYRMVLPGMTWSSEPLASAWSGANAPSPCTAIADAVLVSDFGRLLVFTTAGKLHVRAGSTWEPVVDASSRFAGLPTPIDSVYQTPHKWLLRDNPGQSPVSFITFTRAPNFYNYLYHPNHTVASHSSGVMAAELPPGPPRPNVPERWSFEKVDLLQPTPKTKFEVTLSSTNGKLYRLDGDLVWTEWNPPAHPYFSKPGAPDANACSAAYFDDASSMAYFVCP